MAIFSIYSENNLKFLNYYQNYSKVCQHQRIRAIIDLPYMAIILTINQKPAETTATQFVVIKIQDPHEYFFLEM